MTTTPAPAPPYLVVGCIVPVAVQRAITEDPALEGRVTSKLLTGLLLLTDEALDVLVIRGVIDHTTSTLRWDGAEYPVLGLKRMWQDKLTDAQIQALLDVSAGDVYREGSFVRGDAPGSQHGSTTMNVLIRRGLVNRDNTKPLREPGAFQISDRALARYHAWDPARDSGDLYDYPARVAERLGDMDRREAVTRIRTALRHRSGHAWRVTVGASADRETITVMGAASHDRGPGAYRRMTPAAQAELAQLLGQPVSLYGVTIEPDQRRAYVRAAEGK